MGVSVEGESLLDRKVQALAAFEDVDSGYLQEIFPFALVVIGRL